MTQRHTLIRLLRKCAAARDGVARKRIRKVSHDMRAKEINRIRDSHWEDRGLFGLVHEEFVPNYRKRPAHRWFITSSGRDFLRSVSVNPCALPVIPRGVQPYQSLAAKRYADRKNRKAQRRRRNQRKYWVVRANPLYDAATYDTPIDASRFPAIGAKGWNNLSVVTKIRLLRQRCRQRALRQRFIQIAKEAS